MTDSDLVLVYRGLDPGGASKASALFVTRTRSIEDGLKLIRDRLPEHWEVELTGYRFTRETIEELALEFNEVRSLT